MGLFGKTKKVSVPEFDILGLGLRDKLKAMGGRLEKTGAISESLLSQIPGLIEQLGQDQPISEQGKQQIADAEKTYADMLNAAKLNAINAMGAESAGTLGNLAASGVSLGGAAASNAAASITAKNQASINNMSAKIAESLIGMKQSVLQQAYNRVANKFSAVSAVQATMDAQSAANLGTLLGTSAQQQQMQFQANLANAAAANAKKGGLMSMVGGLGSAAMGMFGGGGGIGSILGGFGGGGCN